MSRHGNAATETAVVSTRVMSRANGYWLFLSQHKRSVNCNAVDHF